MQILLDYWGHDLDVWEEVIKKAENTKAKVNLEPLSRTEETNSIYPRGHKPLVKKDKTNANQKLWDKNKNKNKTKSYNSSSINSQR